MIDCHPMEANRLPSNGSRKFQKARWVWSHVFYESAQCKNEFMSWSFIIDKETCKPDEPTDPYYSFSIHSAAKVEVEVFYITPNLQNYLQCQRLH